MQHKFWLTNFLANRNRHSGDPSANTRKTTQRFTVKCHTRLGLSTPKHPIRMGFFSVPPYGPMFWARVLKEKSLRWRGTQTIRNLLQSTHEQLVHMSKQKRNYNCFKSFRTIRSSNLKKVLSTALKTTKKLPLSTSIVRVSSLLLFNLLLGGNLTSHFQFYKERGIYIQEDFLLVLFS